MAIKELAITLQQMAEIKNKIIGALLTEKYEYAESSKSNVAIRNVAPPTIVAILSKALGAKFELVNPQAHQANMDDFTIVVAGQGDGSVVMLRSY